VSHEHPDNVLLKLTVGNQNHRLHVQLHDQILYVLDTTLCNRYQFPE